EVAKGAADRSYGVQVARLAGLPAPVVERARDVLAMLEAGETGTRSQKLIDDLPLFRAAARTPEPKRDALAEAVQALSPDEMSPREALETLYRLKAISAGKATKQTG